MSGEGWGVQLGGPRTPRRQHYFLDGRSLCGKIRGAPFSLHPEPIGTQQSELALWPCCAKCLARSSTPRFGRKRRRRRWIELGRREQ